MLQNHRLADNKGIDMTSTLQAEPFRIICDNESATVNLAGELSALAQPGDIVALWGDLGAGKTAFARGFINHQTNNTEEVPSPTFTLVQLYETQNGVIYHFDMYRLEQPDDALELGIEDAFADGICLIEWPDRLGPWLPRQRLDVIIEAGETENARTIELKTDSDTWNQRLASMPR